MPINKRERFPISNQGFHSSCLNRVIVQLVHEFGLDALNDERMFPVIHARMQELGKGEFSHKQNTAQMQERSELLKHKGEDDAKKATDIPM